jgi:hypothetical protein
LKGANQRFVLNSTLRLSSTDEITSCFACLRLIGTSSDPSVEDHEAGEEILVSVLVSY